MLHDIIAAKHRGRYRSEIEFDDGACGVVDLTRLMQRGGALERFKDPAFFTSFRINPDFGVLTWGEGGEEVDVAPETL
jgi:hypothetical protein